MHNYTEYFGAMLNQEVSQQFGYNFIMGLHLLFQKGYAKLGFILTTRLVAWVSCPA